MTFEEVKEMFKKSIDATDTMNQALENLIQSIYLKGYNEALEQEPMLDKIRAEIIDTGAYEQEVNGKTEFLKGINYCLGVIDKSKAESEQ